MARRLWTEGSGCCQWATIPRECSEAAIRGLDLLASAEAVQSGQARKRAENGAEPRASWTGDRCNAGAQDGGPKKQDGVVGRDCQTLPGKSTVPVSAPFAVVGTAFVGKGANQPAESQFWSAGDARRRGSQTGQYGQDRVYLMWAIVWQGSCCSRVSAQQGQCCRS